MTTFEARTGPSAPAGPTRARSVLPLSLASFVAVLDSSRINVSLPTVSESLALENPRPAAAALTEFWARLDRPSAVQ